MALKRNIKNKVIAGVCSGLSDSMDIDPIIVRLLFVLGFIFWGVGPLIYIILWILLPKNKGETHE